MKIEKLGVTTVSDIMRLGGKACGLVRLLRTGLPVPDAWVIPAAAVPEGETGLPAEWNAALDSFWEHVAVDHPTIRLAVRSSAVAEDLEGTSFAGIYTTILNVSGKEALRAAVLACRAAMHGEAARAYRARHRIAGGAELAIVLQRMVEADCAGVLLTVNPLRPFAGEMVINAAYGLGEAVVSGQAHPDHIVLAAATGAVVEEKIGGKEIEMAYAGGRGVSRPVEPERQNVLSVSAAQIRQLWEMARLVEERIGPRQDCEWAFEQGRLQLLQQRPITGLPPEVPQQVWSRKFGDEYLAEYTMPLSNSVLVPWITDVFLKDFAERFGFSGELTQAPTLRYEGYAYISGEYIAKTMRALPRAWRRPETIGWFSPLWNDRVREEPFRPGQMARMIGTALRDPHSSLLKNPQDLENHCQRVEERVLPWLAQDYTQLSWEEWEKQFQATDELGRSHFHVIRWGMGFHNPFLHVALQRLLTDWCGDQGDFYQTIISGLPGTRTAEINHAVWELGQKARRDPVLMDEVRSGASKAELQTRYGRTPFVKAFERFMEKYGHRGASREIAQPRWWETPEVILGLVRAQLSGDAPGDPLQVERETLARRLAAEQEALGRAGGPLRRWILKKVIALTQTYTLYRENQRFHLDYILTHARNLILEAGRRLREAGILAEETDVFYLEGTEFASVRKTLRPEETLRTEIEERKRHHAIWQNRLPATYLFDGVETEGEVAEGQGRPLADGAIANGTPASRGTAVGIARVVASLAELGEVRAGEILVAGNTDPGWTSVFPLLSGLITETGGILSHGALLAREYGIPAVTGVKGILGRVQTGDRIELDGATGTVRIL